MRCTTLASASRDDTPKFLAYAVDKTPHPVIKPSPSGRGRKKKEVVHGWTGEQSCPDYGRWGYERYRSGYSTQARSAGCGYCRDRCAAAAGGSATGRGQAAVAWH